MDNPVLVTRKGAGKWIAKVDSQLMGRCEGYYKLENRRCDREAERQVRAADGEHYCVCGYHGRQVWTANVARWHGESGLRSSVATSLRSAPERRVFAWS